MARLFAAADAQGRISFFPDRNVGARIIFASGAADWLRETVAAAARHAHDSDALLVPGIPEADTEEAAVRALSAFADRVGGRL